MTACKRFRGGMSVGALVLATMLVTASGVAAPRYASQAPVITSFTPPRGGVATTVIIVGNDLTNPTSVTFNKVPAAPAPPETPDDTSTHITATVPIGATTGPIAVTTAAGTATSAINFIVTPAPTKPLVSSFKPASGKPGTTVTIIGVNFAGVISVKFGGIKAKVFKDISKTKVSARVPAGGKSGKITVINSHGAGTSTTSFTVH
jgi:hypothetical protein